MEDIVDMYQEGKSAKQIATHFNHPYQRVYERLKAYYNVSSLTNTQNSETRALRREEREKEDIEFFTALLDDKSNGLKRMTDLFPPLKKGEVKQERIDAFVVRWNKRNKGYDNNTNVFCTFTQTSYPPIQ